MSDSKIKFAHYRMTNADGSIVSRGGMTLAYQSVVEGEKTTVRYAHANCSPSDNYSKVLGAKMAGGRMLSKRAKSFEGTERELLDAVDQQFAAVNREAMIFAKLNGIEVPLMQRKFGKRKGDRNQVTAQQVAMNLPESSEAV